MHARWYFSPIMQNNPKTNFYNKKDVKEAVDIIRFTMISSAQVGVYKDFHLCSNCIIWHFVTIESRLLEEPWWWRLLSCWLLRPWSQPKALMTSLWIWIGVRLLLVVSTVPLWRIRKWIWTKPLTCAWKVRRTQYALPLKPSINDDKCIKWPNDLKNFWNLQPWAIF